MITNKIAKPAYKKSKVALAVLLCAIMFFAQFGWLSGCSKKAVVTVSFDLQGGSGEAAAVTAVAGEPYGVLPSGVTKYGYEFSGWYTKASGGSKVTANTVVANADSHTLYARWIPVSDIKVDFDLNGGTGWVQPSSVTFGEQYGTLPGGIIKDEHDFAGWYLDDGYKVKITAESEVTVAEAHTLYARWDEKPVIIDPTVVVQVSFVLDGGNVEGQYTIAPRTLTLGEQYGALPAPQKDGFTFSGWYTAATGGARILSNTYMTRSADHSLYARWSVRADILITFDAQGGTVSPSFKTVTFGQPYGTLPLPTWNGWDFEGWFTSGDGGTKITETSVVSRVEHTLYAQWTDSFDKYPYDIPRYTDDITMNIGTWDTYGDNYAGRYSQAYHNEIAEAGFTFVTTTGGPDFNRPEEYDQCMGMLNAAHNAGMKALVLDTGISANGVWNTANAATYKNHPAFMGNFIFDEPVKTSQNSWLKAKSAQYYSYFGSDKIFFVNLLCPILDAFSGQESMYFGAAYEGYVDYYMGLGANVLSYDNYVLMKDGSIRNDYFWNLQVNAVKAKALGFPLWNFILATAHDMNVGSESGDTRKYRTPSSEDMRWQIAVNQAYGVDGYLWFTYRTPSWKSSGGIEHYADTAPISRTNQKNPLWYVAKEVNNEALAWDNVYLNYDWQYTACIGGNGLFTPPSIRSALPYKYPSGITSAGVMDGVTQLTTPRSLLAGVFKDAAGNMGYMLTNAENPYNKTANSAVIKFDGAYSGALIYDKGVPQIVDLVNGAATISLDAGEGKFIIPLKLK